ncbi:AAA family ATPase, partial [Mycobacterium tuberculosis]
MRVWKHVEAAVDSPDRCGVVLVGPHGVGKTLLAQPAEQVMSEDGRSGRARWVVGTAPGRAIPFGAFRHLISLPASGADIGRPAALLRAARSSLTGDAGDLLLVVDDAHNLDPLSATLVYQLARAGAARLVVTVASEAEPPDAIAALWSDDLLTRVAIEPLDRAQTAAFVESALDATLDVADADELFRRSLGNPLYLRHLIDGGGLEHVDGRWRCRDEDRRPLSGVIDEYLCALPEPARAVVDYLAIAEPLARTDLVALVGGEQLDTLGQAEAAGAVRVGPDSDTSEIFVGHPLYADRARAVLTAEHAHALRVSLVAQLAKHPSDHVSDQLRLSSLAIDVPASATPAAVTDAATAAGQALRLGDVRLAERLARAALDRSDALAARLPLAYALGWQGRGREADAVLAAVNPAELTETELMAWAIPRAANRFWMLNEPERATAFLQTTRSRVTEPTARSTLDALAATFAMNSGNLPRAITLAHRGAVRTGCRRHSRGLGRQRCRRYHRHEWAG